MHTAARDALCLEDLRYRKDKVVDDREAVSRMGFIDSRDLLALRALDNMLALIKEGAVLEVRDSNNLSMRHTHCSCMQTGKAVCQLDVRIYRYYRISTPNPSSQDAA